MRDVKSIGQAAGSLVAQTLVTLADGDHAPSYIGIGRKTPGGKLDMVLFEDGLDGAKAWITKKDKVDACVVGLDEDEQEVRLLLGCPDAARKYDMICSVRYEVKAQAKKSKKKADPAIQTSTIGFLAETDDDTVADDFLDSVLAGIYSHARASELAV
ncbi:MAG: hypothetical protein AB7L94_28110, partial [Kofleriaceae bacterium]